MSTKTVRQAMTIRALRRGRGSESDVCDMALHTNNGDDKDEDDEDAQRHGDGDAAAGPRLGLGDRVGGLEVRRAELAVRRADFRGADLAHPTKGGRPANRSAIRAAN